MCSWLFKLVGPAELALAKKIDPGLFFDAGAPLLRGTYGWWEIQVTISREFGTIGHWCAVKMEIMGRIRWTVLRHANFLSSHVTKPFHVQVTNWDTRDSPYTEHWRQISCRFRWVICLSNIPTLTLSAGGPFWIFSPALLNLRSWQTRRILSMDYLKPGLTMLFSFPQFSVEHVSLSLMTMAIEHGENMALSFGIRLLAQVAAAI